MNNKCSKNFKRFFGLKIRKDHELSHVKGHWKSKCCFNEVVCLHCKEHFAQDVYPPEFQFAANELVRENGIPMLQKILY